MWTKTGEDDNDHNNDDDMMMKIIITIMMMITMMTIIMTMMMIDYDNDDDNDDHGVDVDRDSEEYDQLPAKRTRLDSLPVGKVNMSPGGGIVLL